MAKKISGTHWLASATLVGVVYACSSTAEVTTRPHGLTGGDAGSTGTGGTSNGRGGSGASSATGGSITIGTGGSSASGGKAGSSGFGGAPEGGQSEAGFGNDFSAAGLPDITFTYDPESGGQGGACAAETGVAMLRKRPMDVIVAIDNSESMAGEIKQVQARINEDFAAILDKSEIDYRVILVSRYGNVFVHYQDHGSASDSAYAVCIGAPLSTLTCPASATDATPAVANNPPKFYHHSTDIGSNDLWCRLMDAYHASDPYPNARTNWVPVAPNGWSAFVRPNAYKVFVGITDDSPTRTAGTGCSSLLSGNDEQAWANQFDTALRALDPAQFQTASGDRNYVWYSIVGFAGNATTNPTPLTPNDPVETRCCRGNGTAQSACPGTTQAPAEDSAEPGLGYQYLSILTGGLRYPSCYNSNFNDIFNKIAEGVVEQAQVSCEYDVPKPSHGIVDFNQTRVAYQPGSGASVPLARHPSAADCGSNAGFYFSSDFAKIELCPTTCSAVEGDPSVKVSIDFGCLGS
ncbi:MAG TPA: hypothetical protein VLJ38_16860 [Polyangiaceae bacterium]|nr:hypothetical protein [Polyangiaceae bacterium]